MARGGPHLDEEEIGATLDGQEARPRHVAAAGLLKELDQKTIGVQDSFTGGLWRCT